jgi:hypothetical protein
MFSGWRLSLGCTSYEGALLRRSTISIPFPERDPTSLVGEAGSLFLFVEIFDFQSSFT